MKDLLTPRLRLRAPQRSDVPDLVAMNRDPEVMRYIRPVLDEVEETRRAEETIAKAGAEDELGIRIAEGREDGAFHGFGLLVRLPGSEDWVAGGAIEVGYRLPRASWGQGLATEIARCLRDHAFTALGLDELVAVTDPENRASQWVLQKAGLVFRGQRRAYDIDGLHFFSLDRAAWAGKRRQSGKA